MKIIKIIFALAFFLFALFLGSQNQDVVGFNYLIAQTELPLYILLGIIFAVGFILAWLFSLSFYFRAKLEIRKLNKKLKKKNADNITVEENTLDKAITGKIVAEKGDNNTAVDINTFDAKFAAKPLIENSFVDNNFVDDRFIEIPESTTIDGRIADVETKDSASNADNVTHKA